MAKIIKQIITEFDSCKQCPYCEHLYSGMDGFGMQYLYDAATCKKGCWGSKRVGSDGNDTIYESIQIPDFIPVYCEFSESEIIGTESLRELVCKYSIDEILQWIKSYQMNPNATVAPRQHEDDSSVDDTPVYDKKELKYLYDTVNYLSEQGFNITNEFKKYVKKEN